MTVEGIPELPLVIPDQIPEVPYYVNLGIDPHRGFTWVVYIVYLFLNINLNRRVEVGEDVFEVSCFDLLRHNTPKRGLLDMVGQSWLFKVLVMANFT